MYLYALSKKDLDLSAYEITLGKLQHQFYDRFLLSDQLIEYKTLAFTKSIFQVICSSPDDILPIIKSTDHSRFCAGSFAVRVISKPSSQAMEKELASIVWKSLEKPRVVLKNPNTTFVLINTLKMKFFCKLIWTNTEKFESRRSHLRPESHPTSLDPRLARALVNILGSKSFLDPFCGAGGILIEGGLAGCSIQGIDLDPVMVRRAIINLNHYDIPAFDVKVGDATTLTEHTPGIVTDMPYGKNSKLGKDAYSRFMKNALALTDRMVVCFPYDVNMSDLISGWTLEKEFKVYLHKSLSKRVLVLTH